MTRVSISVALWLGLCGAAEAQEFRPVTDKTDFLQLMQGRSLHLPLFAIRLDVTPDGQINGAALGAPVTGRWSWKDGYFCRSMDWSGTEIPANCQLVEAKGQEEMRFTVDRGDGASAEFSLQ